MSENNMIKSITLQKCPHCGEDVYVESQMIPPSINSLFTIKAVEDAKTDLRDRVQKLSITDDKRDDVIRWLNLPETVFGPGEVENIIESLVNPEE